MSEDKTIPWIAFSFCLGILVASYVQWGLSWFLLVYAFCAMVNLIVILR